MRLIFKRILLIPAVILAMFLAYGYCETYWLQISAVEIKSSQIPAVFNGKKIVFATDFHCAFFMDRQRLAAIVEKINDQQPDIVVLGGDYVDRNSKNVIPCFEELAKIKAPMGIYGVLGNHDYGTHQKAVVEAMSNAGIVLLDNESTWIESGGQKIKIGGVADALVGRPDINGITYGLEENDFAILVSHNPKFADKVPKNKIDLMLAGHTHGGQVTFFGLMPPFYAWRYGGEYIKGLYEKDGMKILVSGGVGTTVLPLRFFSRPEINVITLRQ